MYILALRLGLRLLGLSQVSNFLRSKGCRIYGEGTILGYSVFNNFLGGDTVIWVNFAHVAETKNRNFMTNISYETVIHDKIHDITVISNLVHPPI